MGGPELRAAAKSGNSAEVRKQVEEEKAVQDMIDRLRLVGDNPLGLLQLDQEAAQRSPLIDTTTHEGN